MKPSNIIKIGPDQNECTGHFLAATILYVERHDDHIIIGINRADDTAEELECIESDFEFETSEDAIKAEAKLVEGWAAAAGHGIYGGVDAPPRRSE